MIASILWKEYREQRPAWFGLASVGAAALLGVPLVTLSGGLSAHPETRDALCALTGPVAWAYGLICGAMLLVMEREVGTLSFLDALPGWRLRLWLAKCLAGVVLVVAQVAALTALAAAGQVFEDWLRLVETVGWMLAAGLCGLAWGLLFSAFGRSVMTQILLALAGLLPAWIVASFAMGVTGLIASRVLGLSEPLVPALAAGGLALLFVPASFAGSALLFTRLDRQRLKPPRPRARQRRWRVGLSALLWLTWRQARGFAAGLAVFALLLGLIVLIQPVTLWPLATLVVGVLCGVTTFAGEQEGPFRFLGDQRFPLGRLWLVKIGVHFAIAVGAALIVLLPSLVAAMAGYPPAWHQYQAYFYMGQIFHSGLLAALCPPPIFLATWLVYGFSTGCLCGLLFRSGLAAGVFALATAAVLSAIWVPSMLGGGLNLWQVFGPPVVLLAATRLMLRPWAAGRIASWTTTARLAPCLLFAWLWIAFGLGYRVWEVPEVPAKYDLDQFRASLPKPEDDEAGRLVRNAFARFAERSAEPGPAKPARPVPPQDRPALSRLQARLLGVVWYGWPAGDLELGRSLDRLCDDEWLKELTTAADLPTGMVQDPRRLTAAGASHAPGPALPIAIALAAHGLQEQARGDDVAFVEDLRVGLSLSRALRNHATRADVGQGKTVEFVLLTAADRWLESLNGRPGLLKRALRILSSHLEETAVEGDDRVLVDYLIARNTLDDPLDWLTDDLSGWEDAERRNDPGARAEAQWVALARLVPWEHARQNRMLRVAFEGNAAERQCLYGLWLPRAMLGSVDRLGPGNGTFDYDPFNRCRAPAMQLKLALRWYQAERGKPADRLEELVPKYLPAIPSDPYQPEQPFHYRLSHGEEMEWPPATAEGGPPTPPAPAPGPGMPPAAPASRKVRRGQGVLWSVGVDQHDDGGVRQTAADLYAPSLGADVIFLVPLPPDDR